MKKSKFNILILFPMVFFVIASCTKAMEDPNSELSAPPTIEVISPNNNDVFYTSEGLLRQADLHFFGRDDVTVDWMSITVLNSAGEEVYYNKKIIRDTRTTFEIFQNFSTEVAGTYTVIFEVSDTADNIVEVRRTIIFEHRPVVETDA